jgi:hypothetical protein
MEWMLQVLDEVDDLFGALRFCCAGWVAEIGLVAAGGSNPIPSRCAAILRRCNPLR